MGLNKKIIAIVSESTATANLLVSILGDEFICVWCSEAARLESFLSEMASDLVLIDDDFESQDGIQICAELRLLKKYQNMPIIFISGKASVEDKIKAFEIGASDFLFKPFDHRELTLRIKTKFRNSQNIDKSIIALGNCRLDFFSRRVFVKNREVNLTRRQFDIFAALARKKRVAISREELIHTISHGKENLSKRNIDTQISYMKKNLSEFDWVFEAVHGQGYRLVENSMPSII